MADGDDPPQLTNTSNATNHVDLQESEVEEPGKALHLDLGDDLAHSSRLGNHNYPGVSGLSEKREDNPFSFKHFLRTDCSSYQNKGARPKVYYEGRPISSISDVDLPHTPQTNKRSTRVVPEYSSALPDFVQDHLIVEQCYLGNPQNSNDYDFNFDYPDFKQSHDSVNINRISFESSQSKRQSDISSDLSIPLDLPRRTPPTNFPLDLPSSSNSPPRNCTVGEVGVSKSLPDFLADGAVCSQKADITAAINSESPEREKERLRGELDAMRRQYIEQKQRCESLSKELEIARVKEQEFTRNLAKALRQFEDNLEKSNMKTTTAENTIVKLKQEIKSLVTQVNDLRMENMHLRGEMGAAGGQEYHHNANHNDFLYNQKVAQDLRTAANTAEYSLRQLLTGVDNLRMMASSIENMNRIEERSESFLDLEEDESGPAL